VLAPNVEAQNEFDLIIVGSGLVGASLAVALAHSGLQIALIDARHPSDNDPRLFALNYSSCQFLKNIELWSALAAYATPIKQVHVSSQGHFGSVRLNSEEAEIPVLGQVIPARYVEKALNEKLVAGQFTFYRPAVLQSLRQDSNQAHLTIAFEGDTKILSSGLVIGADGTDSTVRREANIITDIFDYGQSAIVTKTSLKRAHNAIAYERFIPGGAIAMLPLANQECATIWTANNSQISQLMELSEQAFLQKLQKEFGYRLGKFQQISQRHVFSLRMLRAEKFLDRCVFLLGNAAHTIHPIAAQGFNLALYEVAVLVEAIMKMLKKHGKLNVSELSINDCIQKQQAISIGVSHRLSQIFSQESSIVNSLSSVGMTFFDVATPIKKRFINASLGKMRCVPDLLMSTIEL
jgi:2-octaprenyl-6-methoxyphenol hydroxylase